MTTKIYTLKISSLEKGYHDKDQVLLHAAFQLLVDFVEKEEPDQTIDWNAEERHKHAWSEISYLYDWWKVKRPARHDPIEDLSNDEVPPIEFEPTDNPNLVKMKDTDKVKYAKYYKALEESWKLEKEWNDEDQDNLHRLIDIRFFMWT